MSKTIVHVNRHLIAANSRDGGQRPIYSVKRAGKVTYAQSVVMTGKVTLIDPRAVSALPCGARAYLVVDGDVELIDPMPFDDAKLAQAA